MAVFRPLRYTVISTDERPYDRYELVQTSFGWTIAPKFVLRVLPIRPYKVISIPDMAHWKVGMKIVFLAGRSRRTLTVKNIISPKGTLMRGTFARVVAVQKGTLKSVWNVFEGK